MYILLYLLVMVAAAIVLGIQLIKKYGELSFLGALAVWVAAICWPAVVFGLIVYGVTIGYGWLINGAARVKISLIKKNKRKN